MVGISKCQPEREDREDREDGGNVMQRWSIVKVCYSTTTIYYINDNLVISIVIIITTTISIIIITKYMISHQIVSYWGSSQLTCQGK